MLASNKLYLESQIIIHAVSLCSCSHKSVTSPRSLPEEDLSEEACDARHDLNVHAFASAWQFVFWIPVYN